MGRMVVHILSGDIRSHSISVGFKIPLKADSFKSWAKYSNKKQWFLEQPIILPLLIFIVLSLVMMSIYWGSSVFSSLLQPIAATKLQAATHGTMYPNVFISVGEMQIPIFQR